MSSRLRARKSSRMLVAPHAFHMTTIRPLPRCSNDKGNMLRVTTVLTLLAVPTNAMDLVRPQCVYLFHAPQVFFLVIS